MEATPIVGQQQPNHLNIMIPQQEIVTIIPIPQPSQSLLVSIPASLPTGGDIYIPYPTIEPNTPIDPDDDRHQPDLNLILGLVLGLAGPPIVAFALYHIIAFIKAGGSEHNVSKEKTKEQDKQLHAPSVEMIALPQPEPQPHSQPQSHLDKSSHNTGEDDCDDTLEDEQSRSLDWGDDRDLFLFDDAPVPTDPVNQVETVPSFTETGSGSDSSTASSNANKSSGATTFVFPNETSGTEPNINTSSDGDRSNDFRGSDPDINHETESESDEIGGLDWGSNDDLCQFN